ncbi:MAG: YkgJ family cysteine cluster protein [Dethiobacter sp.]|jgi:Fe-S-cluster containining protein|nr:MAG: YkgJ family cysteine cluster protein [Dethiobacter sp.]
MAKKIEYDFSSLEGIFQRPEPLNAFALERMERVRHLLRDYEVYNCPPHCKQCCYGSILMSYTEFTYIILYIRKNWSLQKIEKFFRDNVGLLQVNGALLCPFLQEEAGIEHCSIYAARPLICRVFGTMAAPCQEPVEPGDLQENLFYQAYNLLYYSNDILIALNLDREQALFEAPFALWCLADNSEETRGFLRTLLEERKDSFNAVLYDCGQNNFYAYHQGMKVILSK